MRCFRRSGNEENAKVCFFFWSRKKFAAGAIERGWVKLPGTERIISTHSGLPEVLHWLKKLKKKNSYEGYERLSK